MSRLALRSLVAALALTALTAPARAEAPPAAAPSSARNEAPAPAKTVRYRTLDKMIHKFSRQAETARSAIYAVR